MNYRYVAQATEWVESIVTQVIHEAQPRTWDEDYITQCLLTLLLQRCARTLVRTTGRPFHLKFDAFKARGKLEQTHGDVAIIVQRRLWEGTILTGIGFLEAKKRYVGTNEFCALKLEQIERLHGNTPHLLVLLYDYDHITGFQEPQEHAVVIEDHWDHRGWLRQVTEEGLAATHALVIPAGLAVALDNRSTALYKHGVRFSEQFCHRYLLGYDLDYRKTAVDAVNGFAAGRGGYKFVLVMRIDEQEGDFDWAAGLPAPSPDRYAPLEGAV